LAEARRAVRSESTQRLEAHARLIVNGMVRHGTTTLEAKSGYGLDAAGESKALRVLRKLHQNPLDVVATLLSPAAIPANFGSDAEAYLSWICMELMPKIKRHGLARFADFNCAGPVFTVAQCRRYLETARGLGLHLKVHADGLQPGAYLGVPAALNAVSADHLDHAGPADVELLARSGTMAVLLPATSYYAGHERYAPARDLIDAGAAVALGTNCDSASSPTYSMQMVVALACARLGMTPAEAICAATFNAACAIGCGRQAGSLEAGKAADVIVLDAADYREIPCRFGVNQVRMTIKRGVIIYEQGKITAPGEPRLPLS
jgi:imidazolonepropionase